MDQVEITSQDIYQVPKPVLLHGGGEAITLLAAKEWQLGPHPPTHSVIMHSALASWNRCVLSFNSWCTTKQYTWWVSGAFLPSQQTTKDRKLGLHQHGVEPSFQLLWEAICSLGYIALGWQQRFLHSTCNIASISSLHKSTPSNNSTSKQMLAAVPNLNYFCFKKLPN